MPTLESFLFIMQMKIYVNICNFWMQLNSNNDHWNLKYAENIYSLATCCDTTLGMFFPHKP